MILGYYGLAGENFIRMKPYVYLCNALKYLMVATTIKNNKINISCNQGLERRPVLLIYSTISKIYLFKKKGRFKFKNKSILVRMDYKKYHIRSKNGFIG